MWAHPHHPGRQRVDPKTQVLQYVSQEVVVLVAVTAAAAGHQLVYQRTRAQVGYWYTQQRVEILERDSSSMRGYQPGQRLQSRIGRPGVVDAGEIRRDVGA